MIDYIQKSEREEQIAFFEWLRWEYPSLADSSFSIPNAAKRSWILGKTLKKEGLRRGIPDIFCAIMRKGYGGLFIEMKIGKNKLSSYQKEMIDKLTKNGYKCCVCYGFEEAKNAFKEYID